MCAFCKGNSERGEEENGKFHEGVDAEDSRRDASKLRHVGRRSFDREAGCRDLDSCLQCFFFAIFTCWAFLHPFQRAAKMGVEGFTALHQVEFCFLAILFPVTIFLFLFTSFFFPCLNLLNRDLSVPGLSSEGLLLKYTRRTQPTQDAEPVFSAR